MLLHICLIPSERKRDRMASVFSMTSLQWSGFHFWYWRYKFVRGFQKGRGADTCIWFMHLYRFLTFVMLFVRAVLKQILIRKWKTYRFRLNRRSFFSSKNDSSFFTAVFLVPSLFSNCARFRHLINNFYANKLHVRYQSINFDSQI